jgi:PQQ-dependent catabolism-associated beta-propeller protein
MLGTGAGDCQSNNQACAGGIDFAMVSTLFHVCFFGGISLKTLTSLIALWATVTALGATANAQNVYVSSEKDESIAVFNPDGKLLKQYKTCLRPRDMQFNLDQTSLLVLCGDSNLLAEIDIASGQTVDQMPLGDSPEIFALSADQQTAYVSIEDDSVMAAYDRKTKKQIFAVATGGEPEGVLITQDGKTAYVTSEEANLVHVIDLASRKITKNLKVGDRPRRFAMRHDGKEVWVTNELSASVSVIDTATHTVKQTITFEIPGVRTNRITPVGIIMSPDHQTAWVALGRAHHVVQVDVNTKEVLAKVLTGKRPWGLALSPDQKILYVTNGLSDDMTLVDTQQRKAIRTVPTGRVPHTPLVAAKP